MSSEVKVYHSRFSDAPWYVTGEDTQTVLIGGAGGIGSWLTVMLARAGFLPVVYDFDMLEEINLAGQFYPRSLVNQPKVLALEKLVKEYATVDMVAMQERLNDESPSHTYCFSGFDNMQARRHMFTTWVNSYGDDPRAIFIDGRLLAEHMTIFCVKGGDKPAQASYLNEHIFDDSEVEDAPCSMKQTSHAAAMIASHMTAFFTNHFANVLDPKNGRDVPFKWEYFIPMDLLTVENV